MVETGTATTYEQRLYASQSVSSLKFQQQSFVRHFKSEAKNLHPFTIFVCFPFSDSLLTLLNTTKFRSLAFLCEIHHFCCCLCFNWFLSLFSIITGWLVLILPSIYHWGCLCLNWFIRLFFAITGLSLVFLNPSILLDNILTYFLGPSNIK